VALKFLAPLLTRDQRSLERFEHEALAASALNHPNIVTVYEFGKVDAEYYLVSEYVEGETRRQRLQRSRLGLTEVTDVSIQIASALAAAHAQGIVHRDIKPDNLILRSDGIVKLLDFGIAKLNLSAVEGEDGERLLHTLLSTSRTGQVVGTARYMSPEQACGKELDGRSDLFSLGAVMYEMATGRHAFRGDTANEIIAEILKEEPTPLNEAVPHIDPSFEAIVTRMLRKDRDKRYPSAAAMLADLQEFRKEIEFQEKLKVAGRSGSITLNALDPNWGFRRAVSAIRTKWRESSIIAIAVVAALLATAVVATPFLRQRWQRSQTVAAPRTLAVLPFRNLRPESQTDFLSFSLADAIITKLGLVKELTVRPSSLVDKFRNQAVAPETAARELRVDTLLTGTYLRDGDDLRITAQLIDVKPEKILWQDTIDLKYDRLLTVQDTVAERVLNGLEVQMSPEEKAKLRPEQTVKPVAYEYYLRGVDLYSLNNFPAAIEMLEKAAGLDPNYAPIWAHLGRAYTTNASLQFGGREQYAKAQAAYEKAMALDPGMVDVRVYLANLLTDTGRVEQAVPLMREVLAKNSNYAEAHWELGYAYRFGGMLEDSLAESERARQNNPSVKINSSAMNSYLYLGEYEKFLQSLPSTDSAYVLFYQGFGEYHIGDWEQAARAFDRAYQLDSALLPANVGKALSYGIRGDTASGLKLLRATEKRAAESGVSDAEILYKIAQGFAVLGDKSSAITVLRQTIEGGFFPYPYFERDPLLRSLHGQADFEALMQQARERHEKFKARFF
jgi:serine/threonine-protein kinase